MSIIYSLPLRVNIAIWSKQNKIVSINFRLKNVYLTALTATINILPPPLLLMVSCSCKQEINAHQVHWRWLLACCKFIELFLCYSELLTSNPRVSMPSTYLMYLGSQVSCINCVSSAIFPWSKFQCARLEHQEMFLNNN